MKRAAFLFILMALALSGAAGSDFRDLDLGHWANPLLDRFEAKGFLTLPDTRPYGRDVVRAAVQAMADSASRPQEPVSPADRLALDKLLQELGLAGLPGQRLVEQDLVVLGDDRIDLHGDARLSPRATGTRGAQPAYRVRGDLDLWGCSLGTLTYDQRLAFTVERERQKVERLSGTQMTWRGGTYAVDWAYLRFRLPWLDLTLGRQQRWWGPGRQGTLLVSDNAPSFDALGLKLCYKRIGFESFAGVLSTDQQRFFSGHRGTLTLPWGLTLGASEVVLYRAANLDPAYLNPLLPFYGSQWNQRDDDNILWAADLAWRAGGGLKCWGELLMDDVQYEQDPPAPQKLGFLLGLHWADPLAVGDTDLKLEWAGNQKWVYTQRRHQNRYVGSDTTSVIGHWIGTDADVLGLFLEHRLHPRMNLGIGYSWVRHGEGRVDRGMHYPGETYQGGTVAPGDTVGSVYVGDDTRTRFLSGTVERQDLGQLYLRWEPWRWLSASGRAWWGYTRNAGNVSGAGRRDAGCELTVTVDY